VDESVASTAVSANGALTAEDVRAAEFGKPRLGRRGYDPKSVRDVLQLAARRLDGRGQLTAEDVRGIRFPKAPLGRRGYDEEEVDAFIEAVAAAMAALDQP
jgi:DivIVA domain-containing protein